MGEKENEREEFIHAIRKFMEMRTLTKQVLNELIDHIDVYETQGTGKNKTQRLVIYYKFVGYLDIDPTQCHPNYTADIREGVAIEYVSCEPSDSLKELFSEGYNADDDSFEEAETEQAETCSGKGAACWLLKLRCQAAPDTYRKILLLRSVSLSE